MMPRWQITFWDVGQGDACDIELPDGSHIVIDAGPGPSMENPFPGWLINEKGRPRIRFLILTHLHRDHFGGAIALCQDQQQQIENVILPLSATVKRAADIVLDDDADRKSVVRLLSLLRARRAHTQTFYITNTMPIYSADGLRLQAVKQYPPGVNELTENRDGLIIELFRDGDPNPLVVWSGDALLGDVQRMVNGQICGVLTGPHHGKPQDATPREEERKSPHFYGILKCLTPRYLFVSVGRDNPYNHPFRPYMIASARAGVRVCCAEITEQCQRLKPCDCGHVFQGSMMLGLQPPPHAAQCRGTMRVYASASEGLMPDEYQEVFEERVRQTISYGLCLRSRKQEQERNSIVRW